MLPQYSGGLGILAGDHLKAASDLGVPIIGVGLLYRHGYFKQSLSREGWQQETYPVLDPDGLPISLLREADGSPATISFAGPGRDPLLARIWVASVGRVPLLLLDTDVEGNPDHSATSPTASTAATASTGCARSCCSASAASARCAPTRGSPAPRRPRSSTPTRATPASSASSGSASSPSTEDGPKLDFDTALEVGRAGTVFTTHTPVPAGIDRFPRDLVEQYFGGRRRRPPASRSTGSWRSAPRTTTAATPRCSTWR